MNVVKRPCLTPTGVCYTEVKGTGNHDLETSGSVLPYKLSLGQISCSTTDVFCAKFSTMADYYLHQQTQIPIQYVIRIHRFSGLSRCLFRSNRTDILLPKFIFGVFPTAVFLLHFSEIVSSVSVVFFFQSYPLFTSKSTILFLQLLHQRV